METYINLQAIKKLRQAAYKLWKLPIELADKNGKIVGKELGQAGCSVCRMLLKTKAGQLRYEDSLKDTAAKLSQIHKYYGPVKHKCPAGLARISAPLVMNGQFMGFVFTEGVPENGFSAADKAKILKALHYFPVETALLKAALEEVQPFTKEKLDAVLTFLDMMVEEMMLFHREVNVKEQTIKELEDKLHENYRFDAIIGKSEPMQRIFRLLEKVVASDATVLIQGPSGTGKELLAKAVHYNSHRKHRHFVVQNCSAFNDNLLESELFGHVKGAFTGAIRDKRGLFEVADGGTFFLDEIGDMSPTLQVKLLRVLQEGSFMSVGSTKLKKVDVRIIAATNKHLAEMVRKGEFREDLYYRINVINVAMPPLKERRDDIPLLIEHFLEKHAGKVKKTLSHGAMHRLMGYSWDGNVRELENEIERLIVLSGGSAVIEEQMLSHRILEEAGEAHEPSDTAAQAPFVTAATLPEAVEQMERHMIFNGLQKMKWNKSRLAKELGISRRNLIRKIAYYELEKRQRT